LSTDRSRSQACSLDRFVALGEVARPHGVRGELRLTVFNTDSDLLLDRDEVTIRMRDGREHEVSIDRARRADKAILLKLHSVDDRDRAETLRGALVGLRRSELPDLPEGQHYFCDLEGAEVRIRDERVGVVEHVVEYPTVLALLVRRDDGTDLEVPLIETYVERVKDQVVTLSTLEGLT
jgi:16S rRNA processing protein RimM